MKNSMLNIKVIDSVLPNKMGKTKGRKGGTIDEDSLKTKDKVFLYSQEELERMDDEDLGAHPTDYAIMCGADVRNISDRADKRQTPTWTRTPNDENPGKVAVVSGGWKVGHDCDAHDQKIVCRPVLRLDLNYFLAHLNGFEIKKDGGKYPKIDIGLQFPRSYVGIDLSSELDEASDDECVETGAKYLGVYSDVYFKMNHEYKYHGNRYVKTFCKIDVNTPPFSDGTVSTSYEHYDWAKVEPILFRIKNFADLPKSINPEGTGQAEFVELEADEGLFPMPFHLPENKTSGENYVNLWQNSAIRAYLNGYSIQNELAKGNGNSDLMTCQNYNFEKHGFLQEASQSKNVRISTSQFEYKKAYDFKFDDLSNDEILKEYIKARVPVFLHGVSGVGKSSRVKEIDPDATRITLRPGMNAEEVDGTLDRETGNYIPPLWYQQLCAKCKAEPDKMHVLFIDEITNVKPTVQSLIYSIILERAGKDGLWPLPENCVVVGAGNETAGNLSAYPLTNALFRRFCHIYYDVDKNEWLKWATDVETDQMQNFDKNKISDEDKDRARIHPAIVAFISSRKDDVLYQEPDEEDPKIVTDPRKWEIASNILYSTKNPNALVPAIGKELTADFSEFVSSITITINDVLTHNYDKKSIENLTLSQRLSTIASLSMVNEKELSAVRDFVAECFGKELLATFDTMWVRNDPERALIIKSEDGAVIEQNSLENESVLEN